MNGALLVRNARVLALDDVDREWPRADIVIESGRIAAIGPDAGTGWPRGFDRVIEAEGLLAMPGLINAHFHSPGNLMKGALPGLPLELFMLHEVPPLAPAGDGERLVYVRTMLGALEMLRRGITAVHDDAYHVPVATARVDRRDHAGVRGRRHARHGRDRPAERRRVREVSVPRRATARGRARRDGPRAAAERLPSCWRSTTISSTAGTARRTAASRAAVSCSAPQRVTPDYFAALSALSKRARSAVQHPHPRDPAAARARRDEVRQVARALRARPRPPRRADDGHPRHLDRRARHRAAGREPAAPSPTTRCATCASAAASCPIAPLRDGGRADLPRQRRDEHRRHANMWCVAKTAALLHTLGEPEYRDWPAARRDAGRAHPRRRARDAPRRPARPARSRLRRGSGPARSRHARLHAAQRPAAPARLLRGRQLGPLHDRRRPRGLRERAGHHHRREGAARRGARAYGRVSRDARARRREARRASSRTTARCTCKTTQHDVGLSRRLH